MAWLPGYAYRKPLVLTGGASGAQTDFQLDIDIAHVAAKMQADFDDIRFTQNNGTTLVDAWLESKVDSASAKTWAEFPTTPANTVEQTYYMYYGKVVTNYWDIRATMLDGDDFSGDLSDWTTLLGSPTISGGNLSLPAVSEIYINLAHSRPVAFGIKANLNTSNYFRGGFATATVSDWATNTVFFQPYTTGKLFPTNCANSSCTQDDVSTYTSGDRILEATWETGECKYYYDGSNVATHNTDVPTVDLHLKLRSDIGTTTVDWVFVRKYVDNPPTYAFGAEESAPTGAAPMGVLTGCFGRPFGGII
jgi:hypothetical protein